MASTTFRPKKEKGLMSCPKNKLNLKKSGIHNCTPEKCNGTQRAEKRSKGNEHQVRKIPYQEHASQPENDQKNR